MKNALKIFEIVLIWILILFILFGLQVLLFNDIYNDTYLIIRHIIAALFIYLYLKFRIYNE